jgi:hypothetical protein
MFAQITQLMTSINALCDIINFVIKYPIIHNNVGNMGYTVMNYFFAYNSNQKLLTFS